MIYSGKVLNGVVVLPPEARLPEGSEVKVETVEAVVARSTEEAAPELLTPETDPFLAAILKLAKPRPHWPEDYVLNHGYYVSGVPKKS